MLARALALAQPVQVSAYLTHLFAQVAVHEWRGRDRHRPLQKLRDDVVLLRHAGERDLPVDRLGGLGRHAEADGYGTLPVLVPTRHRHRP